MHSVLGGIDVVPSFAMAQTRLQGYLSFKSFACKSSETNEEGFIIVYHGRL